MEIYTTPIHSLPDSFGFRMPHSAGDYLIAATAASKVTAKKRETIDDNMTAIRNGAKAESSDPNTSCAAATKKKKSRDGCQTCKNKRLKCDETKPLCRQCQKRGVKCEGYRKEFKWRHIDDSNIGVKVPKVPKKNNAGVKKSQKKQPSSRMTSAASVDKLLSPDDQPPSGRLGAAAPGRNHLGSFGASSFTHVPTQQPSGLGVHDIQPTMDLNELYGRLEVPCPHPPITHSDHSLQQFPRSCRIAGLDNDTVSGRCSSTNTEPDVINILLESAPETNEAFFSPNSTEGSFETCLDDQEDADEGEIEDIPRDMENSALSVTRLSGSSFQYLDSPPSHNRASPTPSHASSSSNDSESSIRLQDLFRRPGMSVDEKIVAHFDKHTCGIMSIKDGSCENPWRTLMWPLAQASPALYHALCSMTSFHMVRDCKEMRCEGMEHQRKAIRFLLQGMQHRNIRDDAALATTLVLAFSEVFDNHTTLGNKHLVGARSMLTNALAKSKAGDMHLQKCIPFLYNVWVYLDVLAQLTSYGDDDAPQEYQVPQLPHQLNAEGGEIDCLVSSRAFSGFPRGFEQIGTRQEIDPLLGCATSLFPIIGKVGNLVRRVRKRRTSMNTEDIIAEAKQLRSQLELWQLGSEYSYEPPVDRSSHVLHCIYTAQAYRLATLLYLQQAVPEIENLLHAHDTAQQILSLIFSIPYGSGSCIVHIYPLLVAGCEAVGEEERQLVCDRWTNMCNRMWIGNVDKAWAVTRDVWQRRDSFVRKKGYSPFNCLNGQAELSVRGRLHWARVMKDNGWEVLLG